MDMYVQSVYISEQKYLNMEQSKTLPSHKNFNILLSQIIALKSDQYDTFAIY